MENIKGYCIDTDILIDYLRGRNDARRFLFDFVSPGDAFVSIVSVVELYAGKETKDVGKKNAVEDFLSTFQIIPLALEVAKKAGALRRDYQKPFADAIVAASAMAYGLQIVTRNTKHFESITGLKVFRPY
jgi:predicted nucleic acid-binding protein